MKYFEMVQQSDHSRVSTPIQTKLEATVAKYVQMNYSAAKQSSTQDAVGRLFTHQQRMMQLFCLKIVH
jgi:hypothetical protein